jgi:2-methylcitrate dehydratase PrpD
MSTEIAYQLAKWVVETKYPEIPPEVVNFTKGLTLKTTAGMTAGSAMPSPRKMAKIIRDRKLPEDVNVIGSGFKTSLWEAVFLNAFFAHASELEDDSFNGGVSWDITVVPLLIPLAQHLRLSGKALMEALVVGLEVHSRTCAFPTESIGVVVVPGAVGPAAAAAKALGLGVEATASALGLAMSGVGVAVPNFGTDAHYFESAMQSLQGIMAAEMAKEGLTSNPVIDTYLSNLLGKEKVNSGMIVEGLGKKWKLCNIWVKKYPCCFLMHRHIDILLELRRKHDLSFQRVKKIEAHISPPEAICHRSELKTLGDLQFSFQHILSSAMLDGDVNYDHINSDILLNPRYKEARPKVEVIVHSDWSDLYMGSPAVVKVQTIDGKEFSEERKYPIGSPKEPLKQEQFKVLFSKFTQGVLSEAQMERIAEAVLNLEKLNDIQELMDMLTYRHRIF